MRTRTCSILARDQLCYHSGTHSNPCLQICAARRSYLGATSVSNLEDQTLNSYGSILNIVEGKITR